MPTNHETIFLYCFQYSIVAPPLGMASLLAVLDIYNNNGRDCKHIAHNLCHFRLSGTVARNEATKKYRCRSLGLWWHERKEGFKYG